MSKLFLAVASSAFLLTAGTSLAQKSGTEPWWNEDGGVGAIVPNEGAPDTGVPLLEEDDFFVEDAVIADEGGAFFGPAQVVAPAPATQIVAPAPAGYTAMPAYVIDDRGY
jgi:hypothetical protein